MDVSSRLNRSLSAKVTFAAIVILGLAQLASRVQNVFAEQAILRDDAEQLGHSLARAAAVFSVEPLVGRDYPVLATYVDTITRAGADIQFARIENAEGIVVAEHESPQRDPLASTYAEDVRVHPDDPSTRVGRVVLGISHRRAEAIIEARTQHQLVQFVIAFSALAVVLAWLLRRTIGRPIEGLDQHATALAGGDLDTPIAVTGTDEVGRLAESFERMRVALREREAALRVQNRDLVAALANAEQATRIKSEFLATVSHELRTPLNTIVNVPEGLLEDFPRHARCRACHADFTVDADEQIQERTACPECKASGSLEVSATRYKGDPARTAQYLATLRRCARHLLGIINDLLDFSKLEANRMELALDDVNVRATLADLVRAMAPLCEQRGLTLAVAEPPEELRLRADRLRLDQVLLNLVGNAVKFSPEHGRIDVGAELDKRHVKFFVRDQGIGIPQDKQGMIFESFRQVDASHTKKFGGTGLGLAITRQLLALHQGEIWVESEPGHGATFFVRMPIAGPGPS